MPCAPEALRLTVAGQELVRRSRLEARVADMINELPPEKRQDPFWEPHVDGAERPQGQLGSDVPPMHPKYWQHFAAGMVANALLISDRSQHGTSLQERTVE